MKATQGTTFRTLQSHINDITTRLQDLRTVAASGKKLNKPSDEPTAIKPVLNARAQIRANDRYIKIMGFGLDNLNQTENQLDQVENLLVRSKEIAIQSINGVMSNSDMESLADNISEIKNELLAAANTQVNGKYIFAGFEEATQPFTINPAYDPALYDPADSLTWPVQYNGDANSTTLEISPGETVTISLTGNALFLGDADNDGAVDPGGMNVFATLTKLEEELRAHNPSGVEALMNDIESVTDQGRRMRGIMGNKAQHIESAMASLENSQVDLQQIISRYEDVDAIEIITNITQQETAFQAALQVTANVSRLSILNYLR